MAHSTGKLTPANRSAARLILATGATLATLISAQMFAVGASAQNSTQTASTNTAVTSQTSQSGSINLVITSRRHSNIFQTQTQPVPGSRSSR